MLLNICLICSHIFYSNQPGDDSLRGLQLLQRHGDSNLGFGIRGQLVQSDGRR